MANTFVKIASSTVGSGGASTIDFTSIPGTYTDLLIKISARNATNTETTGAVFFNSDTTNGNYRYRRLLGDGSSASSLSGNFPYWFYMSTTGDTASAFGNSEIYIPNYTGSSQKSISSDVVTENNATSALAVLIAGLWLDTSAITAIQIRPYAAGGGNFAQYTTATLYGIKKN
jgi:hypothetical protein